MENFARAQRRWGIESTRVGHEEVIVLLLNRNTVRATLVWLWLPLCTTQLVFRLGLTLGLTLKSPGCVLKFKAGMFF